jgi:Cu+-exporting ATPase
MIEDGGEYFCCKGCQGVFHLLHEEGLDNFYEKTKDVKLHPAKSGFDDLEKFDLSSFKKRYIKTRDDGFCEISLIIEGIHCSACVWLNEKVLLRSEGIIEADINYTTHKAKIVWDPDILKLSDIILKIRSIGYNAYPYDASLQEERANKIRQDYYIRLLVGVFATMNIMWLAIAQYSGYFSGIDPQKKQILQFAEFFLASMALFYTGWIYFRGAYYGLKNRFVNMDLLIAVGATLTYIYSIYAMISGKGESYFDSVAMIITFVFVGKYLEVLSKKRAVDTLDSISSSMPTEVMAVKDGEKKIVDVGEVEVGDIIEVRAGDRVVIDGVVVSGGGNFDESSLTGESIPVYKREGDEIISGSTSVDSVVRYEAKKSFNDSMLFSIVTLLEESLTKKPKIEKIANEISGYFSVAILLIALATFIGWLIVGDSFEKALIVAISVIVIACPCALGLATPMATLIGVHVASKRGIIFKETSFIESMAKAKVLLLDKTGTITKGEPKVVKSIKRGEYDKRLLYSLVKSSSHPISKGVAKFIGESELLELEDVKLIEAKGLRAKYKTKSLLGGSLDLFESEKDAEFEGSIFAFGVDGGIKEIFILEDEIKEGAKEAIEGFRRDGFEVVMLTGDNFKAAKRVSERVGVDNFKHSLFPKDKADIVDNYHKEGKIVIMAGDGVNDALALSKSDIAVAMGGGAEVSVDVSDVILLDDSMNSLYKAYKLSQKTYTNIKQNLTISLIYNVVTIPLAVAGYVIPLFAALSMSLSSLLVIGNSLKIKRGEV